MKEVKMIKCKQLGYYCEVFDYHIEELLEDYVNKKEMENLIKSLSSTMTLNFKDRAVFEKTLRYGYALAHIIKGE